jgi:Domain of unknown function (DUF4167)
VTPPDQHRSRSRSRYPADPKPSWNGRAGRSGADRVKVGGNAMAKYARYLELAQQAKVLGDEIATQHNLQHAEHWYRTAIADRQPEQDAHAALDEDTLAG